MKFYNVYFVNESLPLRIMAADNASAYVIGIDYIMQWTLDITIDRIEEIK
jgi:hypothetical protein